MNNRKKPKPETSPLHLRPNREVKRLLEYLKKLGGGVRFADGKLSATGTAKEHLPLLKLYKNWLLEFFSPKCKVCGLVLEEWEGKKYCAMGCGQ